MNVTNLTKCEECEHSSVCKYVHHMEVIHKHVSDAKVSIEKELNDSPRATIKLDCDHFKHKISSTPRGNATPSSSTVNSYR